MVKVGLALCSVFVVMSFTSSGLHGQSRARHGRVSEKRAGKVSRNAKAMIPSEKQMKRTETQLTKDQRQYLGTFGWEKRLGARVGVWVSVDEQELRVIKGDSVVFDAPCSTAAKGTGSKMNSLKTPLGWHHVVQKVGSGAVRGRVFRSRKATREVWRPGDSTSEDLILTRVLVLTGDEPGRNKGGDVDSRARGIYVHGTNEENLIGTPASHGCIRLTNSDVIQVYKLIPEGAPLLVTERGKSKER